MFVIRALLSCILLVSAAGTSRAGEVCSDLDALAAEGEFDWRRVARPPVREGGFKISTTYGSFRDCGAGDGPDGWAFFCQYEVPFSKSTKKDILKRSIDDVARLYNELNRCETVKVIAKCSNADRFLVRFIVGRKTKILAFLYLDVDDESPVEVKTYGHVLRGQWSEKDLSTCEEG